MVSFYILLQSLMGMLMPLPSPGAVAGSSGWWRKVLGKKVLTRMESGHTAPCLLHGSCVIRDESTRTFGGILGWGRRIGPQEPNFPLCLVPPTSSLNLTFATPLQPQSVKRPGLARRPPTRRAVDVGTFLQDMQDTSLALAPPGKVEISLLPACGESSPPTRDRRCC